MENYSTRPGEKPYEENPGENIVLTGQGTPLLIPPKPVIPEEKNKSLIWLRSITSLALYLLLGYFVFPSWIILVIISVIVILHELGHFFAMKYFNYRDLGIFFIPLMGAYVSGTKQEVSQKQSAIILLAGPLPGIIIGIILFFVAQQKPVVFDIFNLEQIAALFVYLNLLNLIPIYPLDGGQLLHRLFLDENKILEKLFVLLSAAALVFLGFKFFYPSLVFYLLLFFPLMMILRMKGDIDQERVIKKIENEGVNLDKNFEDLNDREYWEIRTAAIKHHPDLYNLSPEPGSRYPDGEDKVIIVIKSLLQRTLFIDLSLAGKAIVLLLWIGSFATVILLKIPFPFSMQARF